MSGLEVGRMLGRGGVAIDLGTVNTLSWVDGRGLVLEEPSAIAIDDAAGSVAAIGAAAGVLTDREPKDIRVIHPGGTAAQGRTRAHRRAGRLGGDGRA